MEHPEHIAMETTNGSQFNIDALYQLFPSCFTEAADVWGKIHRAVDWGKLRELLGEYVESDEPEKYDFTWVGKRAAQREAAAPCRKTLRPCPKESVDWDTTQNLYIEGDNLEVLKLLQNSYMGKVKMIYIDPPYNTGNDFVYHDDFDKDYNEYDEHNKFEDGVRFWKNTDSNGRFHSDWCSMIYTRLMVARSLLTEDGVIFISIDDNEVENLKKICNEVFGESNLYTTFAWVNSLKEKIEDDTKFAGANLGKIKKSHEYVLVYAKSQYNISPDASSSDYIDKLITNGGNNINSCIIKRGIKCVEPITKVFKGRIGGTNDYFDIISSEGMIIENGILKNDVEIEGPLRNANMLTRFFNGEEVIDHKGQKLIDVYIGKTGMINTRKLRSGDTPSSVLVGKGTTKNGTLLLKEIFGEKMFDFSKPVELLLYLTTKVNGKDFVILDFFSGSATTAHAVMQLNADDGGNRKFIMVQLPEETTEDSEAYKAGYKNICEIGKERIRRAGKKIKADSPLTTQDLDIGFRVLKCDESNYKPVAFAPKDYTQESLDMFLDNIKEERTGLDLLFDCMMRWGLELSLPYATQKVDGCTIYNVDDGNLVACFDGVVTGAVIDAIAETHPLRVVFRDSSFTEAAQKMNLFELFKQKCGWTDQEVQNNVRVI